MTLVSLLQLSMQNSHLFLHICSLVIINLLMGPTLHLVGLVLWMRLIKDWYAKSLEKELE